MKATELWKKSDDYRISIDLRDGLAGYSCSLSPPSPTCRIGLLHAAEAIIVSTTDLREDMTTTKNNAKAGNDGHGTISDETALKVAKEITVKFIEVGSVTPTNFATSFANVYKTIRNLINENQK